MRSQEWVLRTQAFYNSGCSESEYLAILATKGAMRAFQYQRRNARARGIEWQFNLHQWWTIWQESGHWQHKGDGQGYVMCRRGDLGPYAVGNVFIAPAIFNNSDAQRHRKTPGLPIGVSKQGKKFRAVRMKGGKRYLLGVHATPELAHAAYLSLGPIGVEA